MAWLGPCGEQRYAPPGVRFHLMLTAECGELIHMACELLAQACIILAP